MANIREHWEDFKTVIGVNTQNHTLYNTIKIPIKKLSELSFRLGPRVVSCTTVSINGKKKIRIESVHDNGGVKRSLTYPAGNTLMYNPMRYHSEFLFGYMLTADNVGNYGLPIAEAYSRGYHDQMKGVLSTKCLPSMSFLNILKYIMTLPKSLVQYSVVNPLPLSMELQIGLDTSEINSESESTQEGPQESKPSSTHSDTKSQSGYAIMMK